MARLVGFISLLSTVLAQSTLIPSSCFDSYDSLEQYFNYLYPWGSDHNGSARMVGNSSSHDHIYIETPGTLTLLATPASNQPPNGDQPINYLSGAVHSAQPFTVPQGSGWNIQAEFKAPTGRGTWPAFWLNGADTWPPEIDLAEWKGSGDISFNTFNTSSEVMTKDVPYPSPDEFQSVRVEIRDEDGSNISVTFYMNDQLVTTQYGHNYVGERLNLIINLQMEGSSGSPGPDSDTYYQVRNLQFDQV